MKDVVCNYRKKKSAAYGPGPAKDACSLMAQQLMRDHQHFLDGSPMLRDNLQEINLYGVTSTYRFGKDQAQNS